MPGISVVTDSACDLPQEVVDRHGIRIITLTIRFGEEELVDRTELTPEDFWRRMAAGGALPQTAAPSPGAFRDAYLEAADAGATGVLCVTLSSGVSATYQSAVTAAKDVADRLPVQVVDSLTLTMGLGLIVLEACRLAPDASDVEELARAIIDVRDRTRVFGLVGGLDHLRRGGRIGGAAHLMGSLLSIKPVLAVTDGKVEVESKQRTRARALRYLADKALQAQPLERIAVANGLSPDVDEFVDMLLDAKSTVDLEVSVLGPVVGTHTGPGSLGLCFVTQKGA